MSKFTIINEKYEFKEGEVITTFTIGDNPKEYVIYTSTDFNFNETNILVGELVTDEKGINKIKNIENDKERKLVIERIKKALGGQNG